LQRLQDFTLLCQLLGKLGHLGGHLMEQSHDRRFALFKGRMDVFIGRHAKVQGTDHKQNGPGWQLFWDLSSYLDFLA
jgi:hypothetical protein